MSLFDLTKRAKIISRINELTPENNARWGKMNVNQMVFHCIDGVRMSLGELNIEERSNFFSRNLIKPLVLYVMPMPKSAPTAAELDKSTEKMDPATFESDRRKLIENIEKMAALPDDFQWTNHPFFGKLNRKEWGILGHIHLDHHLKQFGA